MKFHQALKSVNSAIPYSHCGFCRVVGTSAGLVENIREIFVRLAMFVSLSFVNEN